MAKTKKSEVDFGMAAKAKFAELKQKVWPKTRKELERVLDTTRNAIDKGEKYIKDVSEKGVESAKKLSLSLRKEKFYYELGKTVANTSKTKWTTSKKIEACIKGIKKIDKDIAGI